MINLRNLNVSELTYDEKMLLLNNASSIPSVIRSSIQIAFEDFIKPIVKNMQILIYENSALTRILFAYENIRKVQDYSLANVSKEESSIVSRFIDLKYPQFTNVSVMSLIQHECYDYESFGNMLELSKNIVDNLDNSQDKGKLIQFILRIIFKFKIKQMETIQSFFENIYGDKSSYIFTKNDTNISVLHDTIVGNIFLMNEDAKLYANSISALANCYEKKIPVGIYLDYILNMFGSKFQDEVLYEMNNINITGITDILSKIDLKTDAPAPVIESVENDNISQINMSEQLGNTLLFGNCMNNTVSPLEIIHMINDIEQGRLQSVVNSRITFTLTENQLTKLIGIGMDVINTMARIFDTYETRHIVIYENQPYILFSKLNNNKIYAASLIYNIDLKKNQWHIINIDDYENNYEFKIEL